MECDIYALTINGRVLSVPKGTENGRVFWRVARRAVKLEIEHMYSIERCMGDGCDMQCIRKQVFLLGMLYALGVSFAHEVAWPG
jgi:hypothetical protein